MEVGTGALPEPTTGGTVPDYVFVDGPLAGQTLLSDETHDEGELVAIEVMDVAQEPELIPRYDYYVETLADLDAPGTLRHRRPGTDDWDTERVAC
ncbi:MAG: hypothetical protein HGA44_15635 [Cellulomonadaceae bacterium]|nr:hypothetical protein [Cellulomonadaceae bacterium]